MADTLTTNLSLVKVEVGGSVNTWGDKVNTNMDLLDAAISTPIPPSQLDGAPGTGLVVANGGTTFLARALAVGGGLSVADGDGVAGDPTVTVLPSTATAKALPVDADLVLVGDSAATFAVKKSTRTQFLKGALHTAPRLVEVNKGVSFGAASMDLSAANYFRVEFGVGSTPRFVFTNLPAAGEVIEVVVVLANTGGGLGYNDVDGYKWPGGAPPDISAAGTYVFRCLVYNAETIVTHVTTAVS